MAVKLVRECVTGGDKRGTNCGMVQRIEARFTVVEARFCEVKARLFERERAGFPPVSYSMECSGLFGSSRGGKRMIQKRRDAGKKRAGRQMRTGKINEEQRLHQFSELSWKEREREGAGPVHSDATRLTPGARTMLI